MIQAIYALSLGDFEVLAQMFETASEAGLDTDRLSFTGCFQILKCRLPECNRSTLERFERWYRRSRPSWRPPCQRNTLR